VVSSLAGCERGQRELPLKQLKLVQAWAIIHETELENNFVNLNSENPTWKKIEPLK
jgi:hypothetical protein